MPGVVVLNVGGVVYSTTESTLTSVGESFFSGIFSDDFDTTRDSEGRIFIDRDGEAFKPILTWMRSGHLEIAPPCSLQTVLQEAEYYSLQGLVDEITATLEQKDNQENPESEGCLRTDGFYQLYQGQQSAAVRFCFAPDPSDPAKHTGSILWTQGDGSATHMRTMAAVGVHPSALLPAIWKEHQATAEAVAGFMYNSVRRGNFTLENAALLIHRGAFTGEIRDINALAEAQARGRGHSEFCTFFGVALGNELMLAKLGPSVQGLGRSQPEFKTYTFVADSATESSIYHELDQRTKTS